jgi:NET1-associated nuclear protein 1 (U3 small nucleolar RNA-associated protein 17)
MSFLGKHLIVSSTHSVTVWDTVDDIVRTIQSSESAAVYGSGKPQLLAVNPRNQTFAIAARGPEGPSTDSNKKRRKNRSHMRIYDILSFQLVFQDHLRNRPLALLADASSGDYIVIDAAAQVQRLGCEETTSQKSAQTRDASHHLNSGLTSLFGQTHERTPAQPVGLDNSSQAKGLASVFGSTPPFSLPAMSVLFRNVVQSFGAK